MDFKNIFSNPAKSGKNSHVSSLIEQEKQKRKTMNTQKVTKQGQKPGHRKQKSKLPFDGNTDYADAKSKK